MHNHLWALSPQTPLPLQTLSSYNNNYTTNKLFIFSSPWPVTRRRCSNKWRVLGMEREPGFEVDQDKAREALNELDLQLESLSNKQITPPKIKASSLENMNVQMREDPPEITGPVLGYLAFILFVFSIFYNIFFLTVIKPAVDGQQDIVVSNVTKTDAWIQTQP
ncbi:hypothetical protein RND81_12G180800 [Saponaria officinalis]|uniref:Uncharacterized protein n=1 Tax=Saponaria officinalis TaxID=3572 RepID=A0AAW1HC53_SAPOF